jgi:hypothetical protein
MAIRETNARLAEIEELLSEPHECLPSDPLQERRTQLELCVCYSACNFDPLSRGIGVQN